MNLPIKCGDIYIKYDDEHNPEYGFEVDGHEIVKLLHLSDKKLTNIILPPIIDNGEFRMPDIKKLEKNNDLVSFQYLYMLERYITGKVKICSGCFKGIKKARILVPFNNSVMLDWGCFDRDSQIEIILKKNLTLKQIYRRFDTFFDYENENWTLIGDKNLKGRFNHGRDDYYIEDYNQSQSKLNVANLKISHLKDNVAVQ